MSDHQRAPVKRTASQGWTRPTLYRHHAFLNSIILSTLPPVAVTGTLTVRDCPAGPEDWQRLVNALRAFLVRLGMVCATYVTEMHGARRGSRIAPHLHLVAFFGAGLAQVVTIRDAWLRIAAEYGPERWAQRVELAESVEACLRYQSMHLAKGVNHYQRRRDAYPPGWLDAGRLGTAWGRWGDWDERLRPETREIVSESEFFADRRLQRRRCIADLRARYAELRESCEACKDYEDLKHIDRHPNIHFGRSLAWRFVAMRALRKQIANQRRAFKVKATEAGVSWSERDRRRAERGPDRWDVVTKAREISACIGHTVSKF